MIAALYARYSSDNQRAESIVAQLRAGREYCQRRGYTIIKEYADEAYTGTNDRRPQYQQMLADARQGLFEVVIFHKVDRSARNEYDYYRHKRDLMACGVMVEYSGQSIDMSTPEGALMENQMVGLAAYYSRNLSREVKKGLKENVLAGKLTGGKPPFGFTTDADKHLIPDAGEAAAVQHIFSMYADGHGYSDILAYLNGHGFRTRTGRPFGKNSLHDILRNRRYIGVCILGKNQKYADGHRNSHRADHSGMIIVEDGCPAIVSRDLWQRVQNRMDHNRHRPGAFRAKHTYLLSGFIHCGLCGGTMSGTGTLSHGHVLRYYRCSAKTNHGKAACANRGVSADRLEPFIIKYLRRVMLSPNILMRIAARVAAIIRESVGTVDDARHRLQQQEAKLSRALERLYDMVEYGEPDEYDRERMAKVKAELTAVRADLRDIKQKKRQDVTPADVVAYIRQTFLPLLEQSDKLHIILSALVHDVIVTPDKVRVQFNVAAFECGGFAPERTSKLKLPIVERSWPRWIFDAA